MKRPLALALLLVLVATADARAAASRRPAAAKPAAKPAATPAAPTTPGSRRLEDIHIEGEIPVPQVLFITARDQRRYLEFQHRRYRRDGPAGPQGLPTWIVTHPNTTRNDKETQR